MVLNGALWWMNRWARLAKASRRLGEGALAMRGELGVAGVPGRVGAAGRSPAGRSPAGLIAAGRSGAAALATLSFSL